MRTLPLLTLAMFLTTTACQTGEVELTDELRATTEQDVMEAARTWWGAWISMNFELGMSFMADETGAAWVGDERKLYGVEAIREDWTAWAADLREQEFEPVETRVVAVSPSIAYSIYQYVVQSTRTDGSVSPRVTGVETLLWVKRDGTWKILMGHESSLRDSWQTRLDFASN